MNIGPYRILRKLGEGGMSSVFLTEDIRSGRVVALKLLAPRVSADETYRLRLLREAHAVASLKHPNITALYEADQFEEQPYIAMEYVEGESVSDLLCSGPFAVTNTPVPARPSTTPRVSRSRHARATVFGLTSAAAAASRTLGSRSPAAAAPDATASSTCSTSWRDGGVGRSRSTRRGIRASIALLDVLLY